MGEINIPVITTEPAVVPVDILDTIKPVQNPTKRELCLIRLLRQCRYGEIVITKVDGEVKHLRRAFPDPIVLPVHPIE